MQYFLFSLQLNILMQRIKHPIGTSVFPCLFPRTIYSFSLSFLLFLLTSGEKLERPRQSYTFAMLLNKEPLKAEEFVRRPFTPHITGVTN